MHFVCFLTGGTIIVALVGAVIGLGAGLGLLSKKIKSGMSPRGSAICSKIGDWVSYILVGIVLLCVVGIFYWLAMLIGCGVWHHG